MASGNDTRQAAVAQAEAIIESRVRDFEEWIRVRRAVPTIQDLAWSCRRVARARAAARVEAARQGEPPERVIEQLSHALTNKFLHDPMSALRAAGDDAEHARLQALLARFYSEY